MRKNRLATNLLALAVVALGQAIVAPGAHGGEAAATEKYIVLYRHWAVPGTAANDVAAAGGRIVASYDQIGVVIAESSQPTFRATIMRNGAVEGAASTAAFGSKLEPVDVEAHDQQPPELPNAPASDADTFSPLQWDMRQISAPEARAITGGSPAVVTGIIDTGVDKDHPDLVQNLDLSKSASCESGAPDQRPIAWDDRHGHGTHVAGTVAAAANGFGIVGTAPNTKLAAIKSSTDQGYFFPEMVVCSFVWAGSQRLDVTNNSYFADPFLYNCRNDPVQRAIWKAEQRAIMYAQKQGVTVVAAEGNQLDDLAHPSVDLISPDFPPGSEEERAVTNACVVIPVEVPGVIGVTAVGNLRRKSFYSNFGVGVTDLTAPGGDSILQRTAEAPNGRVLSTWPEEIPCRRSLKDAPSDPTLPTAAYCYLQGTSMASPLVGGVAALVISRYGDLRSPQKGKMRPIQVQEHLEQSAEPMPCPTQEELAAYADFPQPSGEPQVCQGGPGYNSWYGHGHLNAVRALGHTTGTR